MHPVSLGELSCPTVGQGIFLEVGMIQQGWVFGRVVEWRPKLNRGFVHVCPDEGGIDEKPYDVLFYPSTLYPYTGYFPQIGDMLAIRVKDNGKGPFAVVAMTTGTIGDPCLGKVIRSGPNFGFITTPIGDLFYSRDAVMYPILASHLFEGQRVVCYVVPDARRVEKLCAVRIMPLTATRLGQVESMRVYEQRMTLFITTSEGRAVYTSGEFPPIRVGDGVRLRVMTEQLPATARHPEPIWKAVTMEKVS